MTKGVDFEMDNLAGDVPQSYTDNDYVDNVQVETNVDGYEWDGYGLPTTRTQGEDPGASTSGKTLDDVKMEDRIMNVDDFYESVEKRINTAISEGKNTAFRFLKTNKKGEPVRYFDSFKKENGELRIKGYPK